jgi:hypothetical protein
MIVVNGRRVSAGRLAPERQHITSKPVPPAFWLHVASLRHRGKARVSAIYLFTCTAYNLVRLRTLLAEPPPA